MQPSSSDDSLFHEKLVYFQRLQVIDKYGEQVITLLVIRPTVISLCWLSFLTRESSHMQAACRTWGFWLGIYLHRMEFRTQGTTSLFFISTKEMKRVESGLLKGTENIYCIFVVITIVCKCMLKKTIFTPLITSNAELLERKYH